MDDGLAAFVTARLDEDEAAANTALASFVRFEARPGDWARLMCDPVAGLFGGQTETRDVAVGLYVGRMSDPARVLARVTASRAILAEYTEALAEAGSDPGSEWNEGFVKGELAALRRSVKNLAAEFSDHPDYAGALAADEGDRTG